MQSRREFLKRAALAGASLAFLTKFGITTARAMANSARLRKWIQPLRGLTALGDPNGIPVLSGMPDPFFPNTTLYQVTASEFTDQLHPDMGPTRLWGYCDSTNPIKRHLGGVIVTARGQAARLRVTNALPPAPMQHIIPVDTTLPGANQAQNRIAVHLHGGEVPWLSDGGPFDWWAPDGTSGLSFVNGPGSLFDNIPGSPILAGQADYFYPNNQSTRLMWYHDHAHGITRVNAYAGIATGYLVLDAINNAYVAAKKIPPLADANGNPQTLPLVFQDKVFVHGDPGLGTGTFATDPTWASVARPDCQTPGSLWYEHVYDPNVFMWNPPPGAPPLPNPSCVAEFFGDTMLCNGTVYPLATVEAKRYRCLILNACNARFLNISLFRAKKGAPEGIVLDPVTLFPLNPPGPKIIQIGAEGGFLPREVKFPAAAPFNPLTLTGNLILAPAERADVILDFSKLAGEEIIMYNDAPGPFPGGAPDTDYFLGNPANPVQPLPGTGPDTRQILRFKVVPAKVPDPQPIGPILNRMLVDPPLLVPPVVQDIVPPLPVPQGAFVRNLSLNEDFDQFGRLSQLLGTLVPKVAGGGLGRDYLDPPTEVPAVGSVEVWRVWNLSADTHPIHFHLVNVQVLQRQAFAVDAAGAPIWDNVAGTPLLSGPARGPQGNELGWKETVQMHPGEVTTVVMKFDLPKTPFVVPNSPRAAAVGLNTPGKTYHEYVWHCHILEHEEHDMMRPIFVESTP